MMSLLNDMLQDLSRQQHTDPVATVEQPALDSTAQQQRELFFYSSAAKPLPRTLLPSVLVFFLVLAGMFVWQRSDVAQPLADESTNVLLTEKNSAVISVTTGESEPHPASETVATTIAPTEVLPELDERIAALESAITQLSTQVASSDHQLPVTPVMTDAATPNEDIASVSIQEPFAMARVEQPIHHSDTQMSIAPNAKWQDQQQAQQANQWVAQGQADIAIETLQAFIANAVQPRESVIALLDIFAAQERIDEMQGVIAQADYLSPVEQQFYRAKIAVMQQQDAAAIALLEPYLGLLFVP